MKKTIFTFSAIAVVCGAVFLACSKDDNSATHVGYASQNGTGNNPDPNHTSTTSGLTTAGSTTSSTSTNTTPPAVYSVTLTTGSGPVSSTVTSVCAGSSMYGSSSNSLIGSINISFPATPTAGSYNVVSSNPVAGQVLVSYNGSNYASSGTVSIAVVGGKNVATFNNVTGTSPTSFTLTGGFGCP
jgi:hypothetical protein